MTEKIIKIRGCVAAASDLVEQSVEAGDQFNDNEIDLLLTKIDSLKEKIELKLKQNKLTQAVK
ncbi:MAG: hypothetical protein AAF847_01785 [Bacteroidota bacterium]